MNNLWKFIDDEGTFLAKNPHCISRLYFPLGSRKGLLSSITPVLHGDIKRDQNSFVTVPVTTEDLHNTRYNRNFWVYINGWGAWSAASGEIDESYVEAGFLWHRVSRINRRLGIKVEFTNFVPYPGEPVEIMKVVLHNIKRKEIILTPTAAVPLFARSADRIRDHRHVSALLNRISLAKYGVVVRPTMNFDEKGHTVNTTSYFAMGYGPDERPPEGFFPTVAEFAGEGGNLDNPLSVVNNMRPSMAAGVVRDGKEAMGALRFRTIKIKPGGTVRYVILIGACDKKPGLLFKRFSSFDKVNASLDRTRRFWSSRVNNLKVDTADNDYNRWLKWVSLQPDLRRLFGCSFLPDFDYGRGGRGWRDLWQDLLTIILTNPSDARKAIINNFGGVRVDGSNATIIGKKEGEFIPDRNNIPRVWMDHGVWPFRTTKLYIDQTGDIDILYQKAPYFESARKGTVLEHILLQHKRPFTKIGRNGNFLLEGGDWNDGLDMAKERGESVAFTAAYTGNLIQLAALLERVGYRKETVYELRLKARRLSDRIRNKEWVRVKSGYGFFNGYYDNNGRRVEGDHRNGVRMTLTGQVFPIMSGIATDRQVKECYRSARRFLWDRRLRGFRLNTDFKEIYPRLGRAFGFAYGEKENGSFFSHMNVMFANALYSRGFAREGFEVLDSLYRMAVNTELSRIYPGLPEYFNSDGRGMYHYLTGSASWYILTLLTQVFGIRGDLGALTIDPKLVREQFGKDGVVSIETAFADRRLRVYYINEKRLDYGEYFPNVIILNEREIKENPIPRDTFLELTSRNFLNRMDVVLG